MNGLAIRTMGALALSALLFAPARADDWPQFRHDSRRSGQSFDRLECPLTDVWTFSGAPTSRNGKVWHPTSAVVWRGRVFCVAGDLGARYLCCLSEHTGRILWRQLLNGPEPYLAGEPGCAVTPSGLVYVFDADLRNHEFKYVTEPARVENGRRVPERYEHVSHRHHYVRVYSAVDGRPIGAYPPPGTEVEIGLPAILADGLNPIDFISGVPTGLYQSLGVPLLIGESVSASGHQGLVLRWVPGEAAHYSLLAHVPSGPLPDLALFKDPDFGNILRVMFDPASALLDTFGFPASGLQGYPPVGTSAGVLVGGNTASVAAPLAAQRSLVMLNAAGGAAWHREFPWELGAAAASSGTIFTSLAGSRIVTAVDADTGLTQWMYAPLGLPSPKVVTIAVGALGYAAAGHHGKWRHLWGGNQTRWPVPQVPWLNNQLLVLDNTICGEVCGSILALDQQTGVPRWQCHMSGEFTVRSLAASGTHVFVSCRRIGPAKSHPVADFALMALRRDNGKVEWYRQISTVGEIALSDGLLFLADGNLHMFAPAERTFHLATDSSEAADYRTAFDDAAPRDAAPADAGSASPPDAPTAPSTSPVGATSVPEDARDARIGAPVDDLLLPAVTKPERALADASIVRLHWGQPVAEMFRQVRERRAMLPGAPLLVSLDWLDPARESRCGGAAGAWTAAEIRAFAGACEQIAQSSTPEYFDLGPEVNVYLLRDPRRVENVRDLLRAARSAVRKASPNTSVLLSFNVETMTNRYGHREVLPFGHFVYPTAAEQRSIVSLVNEVDAVGLSSRPQTVFRSARELPADYFLAARAPFGDKPLLVTGLQVEVPRVAGPDLQEQAWFIKRLLQACYWLDARLVAYPDAVRHPDGGKALAATTPDVALRAADPERPALLVWQDALHWKRVPRLSCAAAERGRDLAPASAR